MVSHTSMVSRTKHDGHILFAESISIGFTCTILEIQNTGHSRRISPWEVVRALFHKKKCDGHKLCAKSCVVSSFDQFFVHRLGYSKYWPFPTY
ncbi:hypothetical protein B296_00038285 [Ensete ventricosum]|uniref:Uncharacterized protein n=1 Tax=Ensete ventricosum TaxID=4639 RepID=A0A426WZ08_ENSVE|nr:hypothetical protein B296_00038285 [Ensete ventricosum]